MMALRSSNLSSCVKCLCQIVRASGIHQRIRPCALYSTTTDHIDMDLGWESSDLVHKDTDGRLVKPKLPLITSRKIEFPNRYLPPKQAWVETLSTLEDQKYGMVDLHPEIFGTYPRLDVLQQNVKWQRLYRFIDYAHTKTRAEVRGGSYKPWKQKRTGKARHGSTRSPIWKGGGIINGPRGPKSHFYMLPASYRALGLRVALSVKYAQDDLHIVDSLEIPDDDPEYLKDLMDTRFWGFSCLFVDDTDIMPENISLALDKIPEFNLMPVYGLNVFSMLKHETLVLTLAAVEKIEKKLLYQMHKTAPPKKYSFSTRYQEW
ncbi:large ribosomal subunit protein uL4m-like [Ylistrum balloti]|uniref:large ribosomal subunit protein uL4m-like n=1 Tax=Ylistrum balloti TaxID=509963 RepID=UPI0029058438|nr:large ribosomal subunit protein uL4m-like [Ylistrum balloti]